MIVNKQLLKHPINWLTVGLMLLIIGILGHLVATFFGYTPSTPSKSTSAEQKTPASTPVELRAGIDYAFAPASAGQ